MRRRVLIAVLAVAVLLAVVGGISYFVMNRNLERLADEAIQTPDLSRIPDGAYRGEYDAMPVRGALEVTVKDHAMRDIRILKHDNGQGRPAERITSGVLAAQRLDIEVVAGATYSSKVILKAVQAALMSAAAR